MSGLVAHDGSRRCGCGWSGGPPPIVEHDDAGRRGRIGPDPQVEVTDEWLARARSRNSSSDMQRFHAHVDMPNPLTLGDLVRFIDHGTVTSIYRATSYTRELDRGGRWVLTWPD